MEEEKEAIDHTIEIESSVDPEDIDALVAELDEENKLLKKKLDVAEQQNQKITNELNALKISHSQLSKENAALKLRVNHMASNLDDAVQECEVMEKNAEQQPVMKMALQFKKAFFDCMKWTSKKTMPAAAVDNTAVSSSIKSHNP
ncbi:MAG: hypothetical protein P4M12_03815 [Gammaproteobacteria bacterium]|nr:hypothetical protein [Gammaproteobacteria bacterium]